MTRIVSTKKLNSSQRQLLTSAGFDVVDEDFITTTAIDFSIDTVKENLIFTSSNAVKAVANHPDVQQIRRKPCFAIAPKTAALLDEVGFTVIESADDAAGLGMIIAQKYAVESFTFFCGNLRLETLPGWFREWNVNFDEIQVYQTDLTPVQLETPDGILFFSPSGIESYLSVNQVTDAVCFCIGETTAKALKFNTKNTVMASNPTVEDVIVQCINFFSQKVKD